MAKIINFSQLCFYIVKQFLKQLLKTRSFQMIKLISHYNSVMNLKFPNVYQVLLLFLALTFAASQQCKPSDKEFFVTFHPHLDAFWLNTDDELKDINFRPANFLYAMNQRSSKAIFNSMYEALGGSSSRKFFITQVVFFKDWYTALNDEMKLKVKYFISSGQLQLVNGGWVQNDQAVCYVDDILDQYTVGHNFLRQTFGLQTKIGWATDSFGHSHSQAALQHLLGFQVQGIQRIDDRYIYQRKNGSLLQFYWSPISDSNGRKYGGVFTHIRHFLHQFIDYRSYSVDNLANDYSQINEIMSKLYKGNKLFRFIGNDFQQFVSMEFTKLQNTIKKLNSNESNTCPKYKYGNPTDYFATIAAQQKNVPIRQSDFMPNYDQDHYWSGYFTTNPMLKVICKDFSRLTNLFRKILLSERANGRGIEEPRKLLAIADQLLAVMQHHDGITATSKYHIQELFEQRMINYSEQIIKAITKLKKTSQKKCFLDFNEKKCDLQSLSDNDEIFLTILHYGANKQERIEIKLPSNKYFQAQVDKEDSIFCDHNNACTLVFKTILTPGQNVVKLNKIVDNSSELIFKTRQKIVDTSTEIIFKTRQLNDLKYESSEFGIEVSDSTVKYILKNGDFINFSLQRADSPRKTVQTKTWNKYGQVINKQEGSVAGIYIMANNGKLQNCPASKFTSLKVIEGKKNIKFYVVSQQTQITFTIEKSELNILQLQTTFLPNNFHAFDYFLRISSKIKSNGVFYHDMNGYLVSKRKIGERLDYVWNYRQEDKINANTYPMCSFGYVTDGTKKLVVFTDRAEGFTTYDDDILVNIDRLAYDDFKGVGEGYNRQIKNTFRHKVALISHTQFIQRLWQRKYDELTLGFAASTAPAAISKLSKENTQDETYKWIKYTAFSLNSNQFLLRIFNLNQHKQLKLAKYRAKDWKLPELGLSLKYQDIVQTFANGNPMSTRKLWTKISQQINNANHDAKDSARLLVLEPLQIRTFRINFSELIPWKPQRIEVTEEIEVAKRPEKPQPASNNIKTSKEDNLVTLKLLNPKPMKKHFLKKIL